MGSEMCIRDRYSIVSLSQRILFLDEPDLGLTKEVNSEQSSSLKDVTTQSAIVVFLAFLG